MTNNAIGMVGGLLLGPVHLLAWVVLIVPYLGAVRDLHKGVGEIIQDTPCDRPRLTIRVT